MRANPLRGPLEGVGPEMATSKRNDFILMRANPFRGPLEEVG
jgi:hypothetical protein